MQKKSIAVIKQLFLDGEIDDEILEELKLDERKGVQGILSRFEKQKEKQQKLVDKFNHMMRFEKRAFENGRQFVAGVDEAGRGPLAGPVVAAAVILPADIQLIGLDDSKQLTESQREQYFKAIKEQAISYSVQVVSNNQIDELNILRATELAMYRAVDTLEQQPDHVLIDAVSLPRLSSTSEVIIKGDANSISIAAASVLAKVTRDHMMREIDRVYPAYDFKSNMGYGTKKHMDSLQKYGATPYHRKSFSPVQKVSEQ